MTEVILLRDFIEDQRNSMELYADMMAKYLRSVDTQSLTVNEFVPNVPVWLKNRNKNGMRLARYYSYPSQVKRKKASLFHIMDQGYGHLIHFIDPKKTIITVHDLVPFLRWKGKIRGVKPATIPLLVLLSNLSLKKAQHLIAVSENTKNDLVNHLGCDPKRITVIYSGIDPIFKAFDKEKKKSLRSKWFSEDNSRKLILITGSQFYKNHEVALKTVALLKQTFAEKVQLIKTGEITAEWINSVRSYGLEQNVTNLGNVSRESMPEIYNAVDLLFFPSVYEGFGWPPLEAMACGTPVVASNVASLPEVMGEIDNLSSPYDINFFASKIGEIISDQYYREKLIIQGLHNTKRFEWKQTANNVLSVYRQILCA